MVKVYYLHLALPYVLEGLDIHQMRSDVPKKFILELVVGTTNF